MECAYKNLTKEEYKHRITTFTARFHLRFFLLDTLSQIIYNGWYHCVCHEKKTKNEKCVICKIGIIFTDFEEDLSKITFDEDFLYNYNIKLSKIMFDEEFLYNYNTKL